VHVGACRDLSSLPSCRTPTYRVGLFPAATTGLGLALIHLVALLAFAETSRARRHSARTSRASGRPDLMGRDASASSCALRSGGRSARYGPRLLMGPWGMALLAESDAPDDRRAAPARGRRGERSALPVPRPNRSALAARTRRARVRARRQVVGCLGHLRPARRHVPHYVVRKQRRNWWVALLSRGEGWHNNHHAFPFSARHGLRWFELDFTCSTTRSATRSAAPSSGELCSKRCSERCGALRTRVK
jgi:hypothetical protein